MPTFSANGDSDPIRRDTFYQRKTELIHSRVEETVLALNIDSGDSYLLNGPSGRIWELLDNPTTPTQIATVLSREFAIEHEACATQVCDFLARLLEENVIVVSAIEGR